MSYIKELLEKLKAPLPYEWRVQSANKDKTKLQCTAFVDARAIMNRLDDVCEYGWVSDFKQVAGFIFAGIGIRDDKGELHFRWDTGNRLEEDATKRMYKEAGKSSASDAFKRAAVQWSIGRFLYDIPIVTIKGDGGQYGNPIDDKGNRIYDLTAHINQIRDGNNTPELPQTKKQDPPKQQEEKSGPSDQLEKLSKEKYDLMIKAITAGKHKDVEAALPKYSLTLSQKTVLTKMIKEANERT